MQIVDLSIEQMIEKQNRSAHLNWSGIQKSAIEHVKRKQMAIRTPGFSFYWNDEEYETDHGSFDANGKTEPPHNHRRFTFRGVNGILVPDRRVCNSAYLALPPKKK